MRYILFMLRQFKLLGMIIASGLFVYPFVVYPNRRKNFLNKNNKVRPWYWRFADTSEVIWGSEEENYLNTTYGLYELCKKRNEQGEWKPDYDKFNEASNWRMFLYAYQWNVIRNGCWDYIASWELPVAPVEDLIIKTNVGGNEDGFDFRTRRNYGKQHCTWKQGDLKCFKYSWTYAIGKGPLYVNFQIGHAPDRELLKLRFFKPENL